MFFVRVFRSRSLQKRSGTCLNASGVFVASNLHMEMGKTIGQSIRSEHFWILHFGEFFCSVFSGPGALPKRSGTCLNALGMFFASNMHMG